jgi:Mannose-6-phosphate isomerase
LRSPVRDEDLMPYVTDSEALNVPAVTIAEIQRRLGPAPWRQPIVGTDALRVVLLAWEPGYASVPHIHPREVEVFHVLHGAAAFRIGVGEELIARPGTILLAPPATLHSIRVVGDAPLVLIVALAPNEDAGDETIEQP